jgi:hypothetical protein
MTNPALMKEITKRIRRSMGYCEWVRANLGPACMECGSKENLEVHHVVELNHILLGLLKLYGGKAEPAIQHCIQKHYAQEYEGYTYCKSCHQKFHKGRRIQYSKKTVNKSEWAAMPRLLPGPFLHNSKVAEHSGLTLFASQTLSGIGYLILNGHLSERRVQFRKWNFSKHLGKSYSTSFNKSLDRALIHLEELNVVKSWLDHKTEIDLRVSKEYLDSMQQNPWFIPLQDIKTSNSITFALRWVLLTQGKKTRYKTHWTKLAKNLCISTRKVSVVKKAVENAMKQIEWATYRWDGDSFTFTLSKRGSTPIFSLRDALATSIVEGT